MAGTGRVKGDGKGRYGGRKKGTPNKGTKEVRELIQMFLAENYEEAMEAWHAIEDPAKKYHAYLKAMEFGVPKMASIEFNQSDKTPDWMDKLSKLREKK